MPSREIDLHVQLNASAVLMKHVATEMFVRQMNYCVENVHGMQKIVASCGKVLALLHVVWRPLLRTRTLKTIINTPDQLSSFASEVTRVSCGTLQSCQVVVNEVKRPQLY